ncbi:MAG: phage regulatory [Planctomycetota bacterium]|nr:MAG: phage regulatory [Planctomycetota bacterium]
MQAQNEDLRGLLAEAAYNFLVRNGETVRPKLGAHLMALRQAAQLSQTELAEIVGVPQQSIAFWELGAKPPRSEVLVKLARALGVRVEALLAPELPRERRGGPVGKVRQAFDRVSRLPKRQQEHILRVVDALVAQAGNGHGG